MQQLHMLPENGLIVLDSIKLNNNNQCGLSLQIISTLECSMFVLVFFVVATRERNVVSP